MRNTDSTAINVMDIADPNRSEEHTSELQSQSNLVCRLLLEKKKKHALHTPFRRPLNARGVAHRSHLPDVARLCRRCLHVTLLRAVPQHAGLRQAPPARPPPA